MIIFLISLVAIWLILTGDLTLPNVVMGLLLAGGVLLLVTQTRRLAGRGAKPTLGGIYRALALLAFFLWEVVVSGINVAIEVIRPRMRLRPAVIGIPVAGMSPNGVMLLANLITMTPGTLSLYVDEEAQILYVHSMRVDDVEEFRRTVQASFARRVQEVVG
jgi:multicomponent Na+:H+ antiporter subunit E